MAALGQFPGSFGAGHEPQRSDLRPCLVRMSDSPVRTRRSCEVATATSIGAGGSPSLTQLELDDSEALQRFWSRLSPETRYRRFMVPLPSLDASHLERLLDNDHWDREAIVALVDGEVVGMASYVRMESRRDAADLAVVVADAWQRRGLATRLLSALSGRARQAGIARFEVMIQGDNGAALGLLRCLRPTARLELSGGVLSGSVSIGGPDHDGVGVGTSSSGRGGQH